MFKKIVTNIKIISIIDYQYLKYSKYVDIISKDLFDIYSKNPDTFRNDYIESYNNKINRYKSYHTFDRFPQGRLFYLANLSRISNEYLSNLDKLPIEMQNNTIVELKEYFKNKEEYYDSIGNKTMEDFLKEENKSK